MKIQIILLFLLSCFSISVHASVPAESGDLESYLNGLTFGIENDGQFKIPTPGQLAGFENVVILVLQGNYEAAHNLAQLIDYELVAYTDTVSAKLFYVLRETHPIPSALANGGGTFVFQPSATYNVAIHAPHRWKQLSLNVTLAGIH